MDITFWKDEAKKQIQPELFSTFAEKLAQTIHSEGERGKNKRTQLRKFYDEVVRFDGMLKGLKQEEVNDEFQRILPYLKMLNAKAAYAMGRGLISSGFRDFIASSLSRINNRDDFQVFAGLFEAFMGFYRLYDDDKIEGGRA
ncbi:MAG: hypothetical protein A4E57_03350 [Syntrophorhabdaceae bacterium PtaU1.Bin034]|nr:MAG: hypothetical protein A4E57_03350 [Syntrophorhabdaceae bacterium PtaU1.Bin034]